VAGLSPIDVVRSFFDAEAGGEEQHVYATGPLADLLRVEQRANDHLERGPQSAALRRVELVREDGDTAVVRVDGVIHSVYRFWGKGDWKAEQTRIRGRVRLVRENDSWKVVDMPGRRRDSRMRTLFRAEASPPEGDLEFEPVITERPRSSVYTFVVHNRGDLPLVLDRLRLHLPGPFRLPLEAILPLRRKITLPAGESWGGSYAWAGVYRSGRGAVVAEAVDSGGRIHRAHVRVSPPSRRNWRVHLARVVNLARVLEALAVAEIVWSAVAGRVFFEAGFFLLFAAAIRAPIVAALPLGGRGRGLVVTIAFIALEFVAGTVLLFLAYPAWGGVGVWATIAFVAGQGIWRMRHFDTE
jgi:hypothetical protein